LERPPYFFKRVIMKIALFKIDYELPTDGIRLVSGLLKKAGHSVYFVYLPNIFFNEHIATGFAPLKAILSVCDLAMFSVYSQEASRAAILTRHIHDTYPSIRVIWGGPHCVASPEFSLRHADAVCYGEADQCITEFIGRLENGDLSPDTGNMAFIRDGKIIVNKHLAPFKDLNSLPYCDFNLENQYILEKDLRPMTNDLVFRNLGGYPIGKPTLPVLTMRGCPHTCSYCNNSRYISLFGKTSIRSQSVGRFMDELESVVNQFGFFKGFFFGDDDFFVRSQSELQEFSERYKKNIHLPFAICVSANTFKMEKFETLIECGLKRMVMGVQSVSSRILKDVFNRNIDPEKSASIARKLSPYNRSHGFRIFMDFIGDNPYETKEDILLNYHYMIRLPPQSRFQVFKLNFFPGTPIYERAVKDNHIRPFDDSAFRPYITGAIRYQFSYEMFLFLLAGVLGGTGTRVFVPRPVLQFLALKPLRMTMNALPRVLMRKLVRDFPVFLQNSFVFAVTMATRLRLYSGR